MHSSVSQRRARLLLPALVAAGAAVGIAGCASGTGAQDDGAAPRLSPPTSAVPLWPGFTPPSTPEQVGPAPGFVRYLPVDGVSAPADGLAGVSPKRLLDNDPNVAKVLQGTLSGCPGAHCPLRKPVLRDLTGDGRDELVAAVDLPEFQRTLVQVYRATGRTVRPVLIYWGQLGVTGETYGRDLIITSTGDDGRITVRFRWNGEVMAAVTPRGASSTPEVAETVPAAPDVAETVPGGVPAETAEPKRTP
ncbi:hypothetical protein SBI_09071 [Streptomyces bingchenggensis BCW-1]|uniref:Lipoprotein n=1 Tax=Streptomyces bingchenggensis (strain BCW-1) TaxID=749414 RepID=D7C1Y8_STRBB|nr:MULTISPECIES: hypothetical protein [Streptomyces]ADI12189.1 hypothetical protein SBI_09071 [Streptomyces bingchenggensis BCW-1]